MFLILTLWGYGLQSPLKTSIVGMRKRLNDYGFTEVKSRISFILAEFYEDCLTNLLQRDDNLWLYEANI